MAKKNELAEKLLYQPKNGYDRLSAAEEKAMNNRSFSRSTGSKYSR